MTTEESWEYRAESDHESDHESPGMPAGEQMTPVMLPLPRQRLRRLDLPGASHLRSEFVTGERLRSKVVLSRSTALFCVHQVKYIHYSQEGRLFKL